MNLFIENVSKRYGQEQVLDNIQLQVENRHAVGIIGESGCGKSTLLRQLSGIERPDSGTITINGLSPIEDKKQFQSKIGVVFQKHNLFPHLTLRENITLILHRIQKQDKATANQTADRLLSKLHIASEADKLPDNVSGGQAQRGAIARALSADPQVLFLDEPTAALDPLLTQEVLKAVIELKQDGRDFIFVTHEIAFLKEFADYIVFLKNGQVWEVGDVSCLSNPKTQELAAFLKIKP